MWVFILRLSVFLLWHLLTLSVRTPFILYLCAIYHALYHRVVVDRRTMGNTNSSAVQKCLEAAVGGNKALVAGSSTIGYQIAHVKPYNLDIPVAPAAVTYPQSAEQVAAIVKCAVDNGLKVQPRSGGHSYANFGETLQTCQSLDMRLTK
jgi:hypothetical protein